MSRTSSFLYHHRLPDALRPTRSAIRGNVASNWDEFFRTGGPYVPLGLTDSSPSSTSPFSLVDVLSADPPPHVILLSGPTGSGKTVEAVHAFRELEHRADRDDGAPIPLWLHAARTPRATAATPLDDFLNRVAATAGLGEHEWPPAAILEHLKYHRRGVVLFADLTAASADLHGALAAGIQQFPEFFFVVIVRDVADGVLPGVSVSQAYRVRPPSDDDRKTGFGVDANVWHEAKRYLRDPNWHTPLIYSFLADPAVSGGLPLTGVSDLYQRITREWLRWEFDASRRPTAFGPFGLRPPCVFPTLERLLAVMAFCLMAHRLDPGSSLLDPFNDVRKWGDRLRTLGLPPTLAERGYLHLTEYFTEDHARDMCRFGLLPGTIDPPAQALGFVPDSLCDYFAGGIGLFTLVARCRVLTLAQVAVAARTRPQLWGPPLSYFANRLSRAEFLELLGGLLFGEPPEPFAPAEPSRRNPSSRLAVHLLRGRPRLLDGGKAEMWNAHEDQYLDKIQTELEYHGPLLARRPEVLSQVCRERLTGGAGELDALREWVAGATAGSARLEPVPPFAAPVDEGPGRKAPLGRPVQVLAAAGWVYALRADGRLQAWAPDSNDEEEFPDRESPAAAVDALPGGGIVVGCQDGSVWLWPSVRPWGPVRLYQHPEAVTALAASPSRPAALVGHADGSVFRVEVGGTRAVVPRHNHRMPVRRLGWLAGETDQYVLATGDGTGVVTSDRPDAVAVAEVGVPLTAVLPLPTGDVLVGWQNGRVARVSPARASPARTGPHPAVTERTNGPVAGLAVSPDGAWAADPRGRITRLNGLTADRAVATGMLAWLGRELVWADGDVWVQVSDPGRAGTEAARERAVVAVVGRADGPDRWRVATVQRDGKLRTLEFDSNGPARTRSLQLLDPVDAVYRDGAAGVYLRAAGTWLAWGGTGPPTPGAMRARPADEDRIDGSTGGRRAATTGSVAACAGDRVIVVSPAAGAPPVAAHLAPEAVTALTWAGDRHLCAGLASGALLVLRYTPPAQ